MSRGTLALRPGGSSSTLAVAIVAAAAAVGAGTAVAPVPTAVGTLALAAASVILAHPRLAVPIVVLATWTNAPAVAVNTYGVPLAAAGMVPLLLVLPIIVRLAAGGVVRIDRTLALLMLLLVADLASSALSEYTDEALANTMTFAIEGVLIYALVLNAADDLVAVRTALWMILAASAAMAVVPIFQLVTGAWDREMGGYGLVNAGYLRKPETTPRAAGPIGDPNYFAQILVVGVAVGVVAFRRSFIRHRALALGLTAAAGAGLLLTYSRGAVLALVAVVAAATALRYVRVHTLLGVALVGAVVVAAVPQYSERVTSIAGAVAGATADRGSDRQSDVAVQGRVSEMVAATHAFADHPVLGVGPGVFPLHYQSYAKRLGYDIHDRSFDPERLGEEPPREAHSLPVAMAADLGILGLVIFIGAVANVLIGLVRLGRRSRLASPALADAAAGVAVALVGYLAAGMFLSLAYERYLWLLLALGGATVALGERLRPRDGVRKKPASR